MTRSPANRTYEAKQVFVAALKFNTARQLMTSFDVKKEPDLASMLNSPVIALSALTLELLLKTLHAMHSDQPVPGFHDLGMLYRGLDPKTRKAIQDRWDPIFTIWHERWEQLESHLLGTPLKPWDPSVERAFADGAKMFEQARYAFERPKVQPRFYVDDMRAPLIELIVEREPSWRTGTAQPLEMSWEELARKSRLASEEKSE